MRRLMLLAVVAVLTVGCSSTASENVSSWCRNIPDLQAALDRWDSDLKASEEFLESYVLDVLTADEAVTCFVDNVEGAVAVPDHLLSRTVDASARFVAAWDLLSEAGFGGPAFEEFDGARAEFTEVLVEIVEFSS